MKRIAIITFFHTEATICLANYLGRQNVEVDCYILCDYLRDKGSQPGINYHEVSKKLGIHKLCKNECPDLYTMTEGSKVHFFLLRIFSLSPKFYWLYKITVWISMQKIKKLQYDAINLVGQWPWVEYMHKLLKDTNIVHSLHEVGSHMGDKPTHYIKTLINDQAKLIFHSSYLRDIFSKFDSRNQCKKKVIPFGLFEVTFHSDSNCVIPLSVNLDKITFLFYGFIKPYKGLDLLKSAYNRLSSVSDKFNLIIAGAGDDPTLPFFREQENVCVINRFLSDDEMSYLNRACQVVLLPYKSASQSGIIPTSFMYGNPVIATKVGAMPETIKHGENGFLVNANDAQGYADAMKILIDEPQILYKLHRGALAFGHGDEYDWNIIAKSTIKYLME